MSFRTWVMVTLLAQAICIAAISYRVLFDRKYNQKPGAFVAHARQRVLLAAFLSSLCLLVAILSGLGSVALCGCLFLMFGAMAFRMELAVRRSEITIRWLMGNTVIPSGEIAKIEVEHSESEDYGKSPRLILYRKDGARSDLTVFSDLPCVQREVARLAGGEASSLANVFSCRQRREWLVLVLCWFLLLASVTLVATNTIAVVPVGSSANTTLDE